MRVQFLATEQHYRDHLRPVYDALPRSLRGVFACSVSELPDPSALTVVASFGDYRKTTGPVIYFEHGVGFSFGNHHQSYAGGRHKHRVVLFCSTNDQVDTLNRSVYPHARHVIVGCPKLDRWAGTSRTPGTPATVAVSFHWDATNSPETRWAFPHYQDILADLAGWGYRVIGHGHPRAWPDLAPVWAHYGWELVPDFAEVMERADLYVADATSTLYEFATVGPVVVLNAPWYRRDVDHGLRFWRHIPGIQVDEPGELRAAIRAALNGRGIRLRRAAVEAAYPHLGNSTKVAVAAISALVRDYRHAARRDPAGTLETAPRHLEDESMKNRVIATERLYVTLPNGSRKLVANVGDEIPAGYEPVVMSPPPPAPEETKARREDDVEDKAMKPSSTRKRQPATRTRKTK
jgi:hypothetical protein